MAIPLPSTETPRRAELLATPDGVRYLKSWLLIRLLVGVLGLALPAALLLGDKYVLAGSPGARGSMSAYYHSGMRDVFVGTLCIIGMFLITYMIFHYNWENVFTIGAGAAAVVVALFPTFRDRPDQVLTPLQQKLGEPTVAHVHAGAALAYIGLLALVSAACFGRRELREHHRPGRAALHLACGGLMVVTLLLLGVAKLAGIESVAGFTPLLLGELACTVLFGLSWLVKGSDIARELTPVEPAPEAPPVPALAEAGRTP
jgi:MFS family permease